MNTKTINNWLNSYLDKYEMGVDPGDTEVVVKLEMHDKVEGVARCSVCGRKLKDPKAIARGMGRVCWRKNHMQLKMF